MLPCAVSARSPRLLASGGLSGGRMRLWLELPDGTVRQLNSKGSFRVPAGARLVMEPPGSGGYGPPSFRDDALVRDDRAFGPLINTWKLQKPRPAVTEA